MLEHCLSYLITAVAFLPVIIAASSYALVVFYFVSIAIHSLGRKRKDAARKKDSKLLKPSMMKTTMAPKVTANKAAVADETDPNDTRDLFAQSGLLQDDVIIHICGFLTPRSVTTLACVNRATRKLIDDNSNKLSRPLWQSLWFRDYGRILLTWDVSRETIFQSLMAGQSPMGALSSTTNIGALVSNALTTRNTKEFYFRFQLAFVDYILAGRNQNMKCLMGLHGHIFDFTEFAPSHPGLSEPIVRECGQDVTGFFEDIRHSKGARRIACKLCLIVDRSCFQVSNNDFPCGLYCPPRDIPNMLSFLRQTNTRPPPGDPNVGSSLHEKVILPMRGKSSTWRQQPRTLEKFGTRHKLARKLALTKTPGVADNAIRPYYDPFVGKWKGWYTGNQWNTFHVDFDV
jgi:hypothetical protein